MKRLVSCLSVTLVLGIALALPSEARADEPSDAPLVDLTADDGRATIERRTSTVGPNGLAIVEMGIFSLAHWEHACVAPCQLRLDPRYTYRVAGDGLVPTEGFTIPRGPSRVRVDAKMGSSTGRVSGALVAGGGALALAAGAAALIATPILESEDVGSQGFRSALFAGGIGAASVGLVAWGWERCSGFRTARAPTRRSTLSLVIALPTDNGSSFLLEVVMFIRHACVASLLVVVGCGGSSSGIEDPAARDGSVGAEAGAPVEDGAGPAISGPEIAIVMRGSTAPFTHADSFGGATPKKEIVAIKSLYLLRQPADPSPLRVFDLGAKAVEVELVTGQPVEITRVVAKTLPAGVFTIAKAGVSYVKYAVDARMHATIAVDGRYDNVQALSEGAVIDGAARKKGYFRYAFVAGGVSVGALEGENAPVPAVVTSGGIGMDASGPETFYVFPVELVIDPNVTTDHEALFEVNVHESFRWQDQSSPGYQSNVFDTTPTSFEPVMAFGANTFKLTMTAK